MLKTNLKKHRVFKKLEFLHHNKANIPWCEYQKKFNNWDKYITQLMLGAENRCNKFYNNTIEFSPLVGIYDCRLRAYRWIQLFKLVKPTYKKNLWRTCKRMQIPRPDSLTQEGVTGNIDKCIRRLAELKEKASKLRGEHLAARLVKAQER